MNMEEFMEQFGNHVGVTEQLNNMVIPPMPRVRRPAQTEERQLRATWSLELEQDLLAVHGIKMPKQKVDHFQDYKDLFII